MARAATVIDLSTDDRRELEGWVRRQTAPQRQVQRARIVLASAAGKTSREIAREMGLRSATVSKWRVRFARLGVAGLADAPRPGKPATYDRATERRILAQLDQPPPAGFATWNGRLVAQALGDVSTHQVWRVLRHHRISCNGGAAGA